MRSTRSIRRPARALVIATVVAVSAYGLPAVAAAPSASAAAPAASTPPGQANIAGMTTSPLFSQAGGPSVQPGPPDPVAAAVNAARAQAAASGQRVHVAELDTASKTTYENQDGTVTTDYASGPIRIRQGTGWTPIDTTLVPVAGAVAPKATSAAESFSAGGTGPALSVGNSAGGIDYGWAASLPAPSLSGSTATYPNVLPGTDLLATSYVSGAELSLLLHNRPAGPLGTIRIPMHLRGLTLTQNSDGSLTLTNAAGAVVAKAGAPTMYGATLDPHTGLPARSSAIKTTVVQTAAGPELDLTPDSAWLADPATSYPVTIDPTTNLSDTIDTFVDNTYPSSDQKPAAPNELRVGNYGSGIAGSNVDRSFLGLSDAAIQGTSVTSATLNLYELHQWNCAAEPVTLANTNPFGAGITWNTQPARSFINITTNTSAGDSCGGARWVGLNATDFAKGISGTGHSTDQAGLYAPNEADVNQFHRFSSRNVAGQAPYLSVTYDTTPGSVSGLNTQFTDTYVPKMSGVVHDADGSAQTATFTVKTSGGTTLAAAGGTVTGVANGATASYQVNGSQLKPNNSYTWSMHTCNGSLCSAESAAQPFTLDPMLGSGGYRGHTSISAGSSQQAKVSVDVASGNARVAVSGLTLKGSAGGSLPLGASYDSLATAAGASPASGSGGAGLGWRFSTGPANGLVKNGLINEFVNNTNTFYAFCCEPNTIYYQPANYDATLNKDSATGMYKLVEHASQTEYDMTSSGQLIDQLDRNKNGFWFFYDSSGGLSRIDAKRPDGTVIRSVTVTTDGSHRITGLSQAGDANTPTRTVVYRYNAAGYIDQVTDPTSGVTGFGYDGSGNLTSVTSAAGRQVTLGYDGSHRATSVTQKDPAGTDAVQNLVYSSPATNSGQTKVYDPNHPVSSGLGTTYDSDNTGKITKVTDAAGQTATTSYTSLDNVHTSTGSAGTTTNSWQANKPGGSADGESMTSSQGPSGAVDNTAYGNTGPASKYLPSSSTDSGGSSTNFAYDTAGNSTSSASSGGSGPAATAAVTRNTDGTVKDSTDPNNAANGSTPANPTTYAYDNVGQLTGVTPPATGNTNNLGHRSFTYDAFGRQATSTSGTGVTTTYSYDAANRLLGQSTPGAPSCPSPGSATTVCYTYDADGNSLTRTDAAGTATFTYDGQSRQTSKDVAGPTVTYHFDYTHDPAGDLTQSKQTQAAAVHTVGYHYNLLNLLDQSTENDGTTSLFAYDAGHQRTDTWDVVSGTNAAPTYSTASTWQLLAPTGFAAHTHNTVIGGKLLETKTTTKSSNADAARVADLSYSYDLAVGPCVSTAPANPHTNSKQTLTDHLSTNVTSYCHDPFGRLTEQLTKTSTGGPVSDYSYTYDADGNRTTGPEGGHSYNAVNQLTDPGVGAAFDADGNQTQPNSYSYNATDQTTSFGPTGATYAGADQKERTSLGSTTYASGATGTASITTAAGTTYYDRDPSGALISEHGPDGDLYYYFDGHGSVIGLLNRTGDVQATYSYDAYGAHASTGGPNTTAANNNPWQYTSGLLDGATGLYKYGQRYYNPALGSWTQQDSIERPGDLSQGNRYAYAGDNPIDHIDPSGNDAICLSNPNNYFCSSSPPSNDNICNGTSTIYQGGAALLLPFVGEAAGPIGIGLGIITLGCGIYSRLGGG